LVIVIELLIPPKPGATSEDIDIVAVVARFIFFKVYYYDAFKVLPW
jgi:hypothetical protein